MYAQNSTLKSRLVFETLGIVATFMQSQTQKEKQRTEQFITRKLGLPVDFVACHVALQNQYHRHHDAALSSWAQLGDWQAAHQVFM